MKNFILPVAVIMILPLIIAGCGNKSKQIDTTTVSKEVTTVNVTELQSELRQAQENYNNITKIYDDSVYDDIKTYCDKYLSYNESSSTNINDIKGVVSTNYYAQLETEDGHLKQSNKSTDYEQSTGIDELYYQDYAAGGNNISVCALCKQTVINDDKVDVQNKTYIFYLIFNDNKWKIDSVEIIGDETNG